MWEVLDTKGVPQRLHPIVKVTRTNPPAPPPSASRTKGKDVLVQSRAGEEKGQKEPVSKCVITDWTLRSRHQVLAD